MALMLRLIYTSVGSVSRCNLVLSPSTNGRLVWQLAVMAITTCRGAGGVAWQPGHSARRVARGYTPNNPHLAIQCGSR